MCARFYTPRHGVIAVEHRTVFIAMNSFMMCAVLMHAPGCYFARKLWQVVAALGRVDSGS